MKRVLSTGIRARKQIWLGTPSLHHLLWRILVKIQSWRSSKAREVINFGMSEGAAIGKMFHIVVCGLFPASYSLQCPLGDVFT